MAPAQFVDVASRHHHSLRCRRRHHHWDRWPCCYCRDLAGMLRSSWIDTEKISMAPTQFFSGLIWMARTNREVYMGFAWPLRSLSLTPLVTAIAVVVAHVAQFLVWCAGPEKCHEILVLTFDRCHEAEVPARRSLHGGACTEMCARRNLHGRASTEGPARMCPHGDVCTEVPARRYLRRGACTEASARQ